MSLKAPHAHSSDGTDIPESLSCLFLRDTTELLMRPPDPRSRPLNALYSLTALIFIRRAL